MKNIKHGLFILIGVCAAMVLLMALLALLPDWARAFAITVHAVTVVLAAGGMAALLYLGTKTAKKLRLLEEIVRPLEKKNYPALGKNASGPYMELGAASADLAKFAGAFKVHAAANAKIEALLRTEAVAPLPSGAARIAGWFNEIENAAGQGLIAFEQVESYFTSINKVNRSQSLALETAGGRFTEMTELGKSVSFALEESGRRAGALKDTINAGEEQSRNTYAIIKNTSADLEKITGIVKTINDISEQTNILSMNAAIESAHAGAAGAGFAVVAAEIKKLAESTKINARDIREVLLSITRQISEAQKASETSSATFGFITTEIAGFAETLYAAAETTKKSGYAGEEILAALKDSGGRTDTITDRSADIAVLKQSFTAALSEIRALASEAQGEAEGTGAAMLQNRERFEKALGAVQEYLKETEELEGIFFSAPAISIPSAGGADVPEEKSNSAKGGGAGNRDSLSLRFERNAAGAAEKAGYAGKTTPAKNAAPAEVDNSWRKDVAVKKPPRTV